MSEMNDDIRTHRGRLCVGMVFGGQASASETEHCLRLAALLQANGVAVVPFCPDAGPAFSRVEEAGLMRCRLHSRSRCVWGSVTNAVTLARLCRRIGIDVLSVHNMAGHRAAVMASALGSRAAVVRAFHEPRRLAVNILNEWTLSRTSQILAVSAWTLSSLGPLGEAVDSHCKHVVPPGVDAQAISPARRSASLREQWGAKTEDVVVGLPVTAKEADGVSWFLNAALALKGRSPSPRWMVLDLDGSENAACGAVLARRMSLTDRFTAVSMPDDRATVLASLDLVVIPSSGLEDSLILALESMATEAAPIVADFGGLGEIVTHGQTGMLAIRGDSRSLADAIAYMLDNRAFRRIMARAARDHAVGGFSQEKWICSIRAIYERAAHALPHNVPEDDHHEESGRIVHRIG